MSRVKMVCPDCGIDMNQHAIKIDYGENDPALFDPAFGGALKEAHTCPKCGKTELRPASPDRHASAG